jgi:hypothetical protein
MVMTKQGSSWASIEASYTRAYVDREKCLVQQKIDRKIRQHLPYKWLPRSAYFSPKQKSINISGVIGTHFQKPVNNSHKKSTKCAFPTHIFWQHVDNIHIRHNMCLSTIAVHRSTKSSAKTEWKNLTVKLCAFPPLLLTVKEHAHSIIAHSIRTCSHYKNMLTVYHHTIRTCSQYIITV